MSGLLHEVFMAYQVRSICRQSAAHQYHLNGPVYHKEYILKIVKVPRPMRMVWGSLVAYWLSGIINPAFVAIAVMIALFIPVLVIDPYFPSRPEN